MRAQVARPLGVLLIIESLLTGFAAYATELSYPGDLLEDPASVVLPYFAANQAMISGAYYLWAMVGILLIPIALGFHDLLAAGAGSHKQLKVFTAFGIIGGLFQLLDFIQWPFLVTRLAAAYTNPTSSAATRDAVVVAYDSFNAFFGDALGGHLAFLFIGIWGVAMAVFMLRTAVLPRWLAWVGIVTATLMGSGEMIEFYAGADGVFGALGPFVTPSFHIWLLVVGAIFLWARGVPLPQLSVEQAR